jgi:tetratricopeptide (TPR) repeat protein
MVVIGGMTALLLASVLVPGLRASGPQKSDLLVQVLGGTTEFVADKAFLEADVYFHGGQSGGCLIHGHHEHAGDEHESQDGAQLPLKDVVSYLHGETAPKVHKHLAGEQEKELLPWFVAVVRLNPHHIDAWRTGSYWFYRTGDSKRAEEFISEGMRRNPGDYRLYLDRGILEYRLRNWEKAVSDLDTAERLWKNDSSDAPSDLRAIGLYRSDALTHLRPAR